ncbi:hypothetical protein [Magnetovibrio blakemorei]|uniref:hypothetical protein n=1 Tax=Magnetovibrio blakemorei TaxID=28181 RepID=UPI00147D91CE|nr:hypothetical protein [Magnetovibrio blakemorei]
MSKILSRREQVFAARKGGGATGENPYRNGKSGLLVKGWKYVDGVPVKVKG